jgi:hypothetical protein
MPLLNQLNPEAAYSSFAARGHANFATQLLQLRSNFTSILSRETSGTDPGGVSASS